MASTEARARLAAAQRRLVEALVSGDPEGTGMDPVAFEIQSALLEHRRRHP